MTDQAPSVSTSPGEGGGAVKPAGREVRLPTLVFLAFIVGIVAAFAAIVFKYLIALIYNVSFYGVFSIQSDPNAYGAPSPWGPFLILVPVIGGLIVVYLVKTFAPEAKGHGVPEVMFAVYHRGGNIRAVVALIKSLASALSIGTGASVGREGPVIQIGASFGSSFGRQLGLIRSQKIILLAAGAGAGIAATFNTPLGGVIFAVEVLLPEISPRSFLPVVAATATSTYIFRLVIGSEAAFDLPIWTYLPRPEAVNFAEIGLAAVTGIIMGFAAFAFVQLYEILDDWFDRLKMSDYAKNAMGMFAVGLLGYGFVLVAGHHHVLSVGTATIQDILSDGRLAFLLLCALFVAKLLATTISLTCGASGGVFSPSLFMGATLGAAIGTAGQWLMPEAGLSVPLFAMIGMGALAGAGTTAAMTAIVMIFEMTRDYNIVLPLVLAVALALGIRRALIASDIYTIKLRRRPAIPTDRTTNMFLVQPASDIMSTSFKVLPMGMGVGEALAHVDIETNRVVVTDESRIVGFVRFAAIPYQADRFVRQSLGDIMKTDYVIATPKTNLNSVITRMSRRDRSYAIVVSNASGVPRAEDVVGVIDREELANAVVKNHYS